MTTPAVNESTQPHAYYDGTMQKENDPPTTTSALRYSRSVYRVRPESSSSPIRADGSRAPKAWNHRWGTWVGVPTPITVLSSWLGKTYTCRLVVPTGWRLPAVTQKVAFDSMFSQVDMLWLNGNNISDFPVSVQSAAVTRFRLAALSGVADLGVTLGELRQTAHFVTDLCRGVESTIRHIADDLPAWYSPKKGLSSRERRKQNVRRVVALLKGGRPARRLKHESAKKYRRRIQKEKQILQDWLTFQFAVKPLMTDLVSAVEAFDYWKNARQVPMRVTVKKGASNEWQETVQRNSVQYGNRNGYVNEEFRVLISAGCHYSGIFEMLPSDDRTLAQLGLNNPFSVAWELVPFSWLVDYGLGVGNWIKSMTSLDHMTWIEGSVSKVVRMTSPDGVVHVSPAGSQTLAVYGEGKLLLNCGRFQREVLQHTPLPGAMPVPKKELGLNQLANALSALAGLTDTRGLRI